MTRLLAPSGVELVAVEPLPEMRAELERQLPGIAVLAGTAERIPLADSSVDAVTVGQAFHWFRAGEALREIHRVLRPGGGLALIWNARDERQPLQAALSAVIDPLEGDTPRRRQRNWRTLLADSGLFERSERTLYEPRAGCRRADARRARALDQLRRDGFRDERDEVEARVRALARTEQPPVRLAYMTELYLGFAVD